MELITNSNFYVRPNFQFSEFYSKSINAPEEHFLSTKVMNGWQALRNWADSAIGMSSTFRTTEGNIIAGGGYSSQHLTGNAGDGSFLQNQAELMQAFYGEMVCKGPLYFELRSLGIMGIGFYNTFIHLDDGESPLNFRQSFAIWDQSNGQYGPVELSTSYMLTVPEPTEGNYGNPNCGSNGSFIPSNETIERFKKKKGIFIELISWTSEEGITWNTTQKIAAISICLFLLSLPIVKIFK